MNFYRSIIIKIISAIMGHEIVHIMRKGTVKIRCKFDAGVMKTITNNLKRHAVITGIVIRTYKGIHTPLGIE